MLFLTRHFGVTGSAADRDPAREKAEIEEIIQKSLLLQAKAAAQQHRAIGRGTHVKGVCARAQFEVLDVTAGRDEARDVVLLDEIVFFMCFGLVMIESGDGVGFVSYFFFGREDDGLAGEAVASRVEGTAFLACRGGWPGGG